MNQEELLAFVVQHPVKIYFKYKWGFKYNIAEHLVDLGDALLNIAQDIGSMFRSLFWLIMCAIAVLVWPIAKAILVWRLRKRIIKEKPYMKATTPKGEYRI